MKIKAFLSSTCNSILNLNETLDILPSLFFKIIILKLPSASENPENLLKKLSSDTRVE